MNSGGFWIRFPDRSLASCSPLLLPLPPARSPPAPSPASTEPLMALWTCLLFPSLPLDVFARALAPHEAVRPFVVGSGGRSPRIVRANAAARATGIRDGQLVSGALALAPDLVLRDRDGDAEARALAQIATWVLSFTPTTCLAPPAAVVAEIGSSLRLFGGLPRLVARLTTGVRELGYTNRLGIAATPDAALLLARAGDPVPVHEVERLPETLAPLPLTLLDLPEATQLTLRDAGVVTFGQAAALPRDGAARRFGNDFVLHIDRTLGRAPDPRAPFVPSPRFTGRLELPVPVHEVEALGFGVQRLVRDLADWLLVRGLGALRLTLTLAHEHYLRARGQPSTVVPFALGAPARTAAHLFGVLRERLARVTLPAPVEAITLDSEETVPLAGRNLGLLPGDECDKVDVPLLDRLRAHLGDEAIHRLVSHAEHRPELAMRVIAGHAAAPATMTLPPDMPRPLWLLTEPQPLGSDPSEAVALRRPPSVGAKTRGSPTFPGSVFEREPWILRDGPERIESGWWDGSDIRRDYFIADTADGKATAWIYCDRRRGLDSGEWFLHGLFA